MKVNEVADQFGVSRRTVYKWLARYKSNGEAALHNCSSRPGRSHRRLAVERVAFIAVTRRMPMTSPATALPFLCLFPRWA